MPLNVRIHGEAMRGGGDSLELSMHKKASLGRFGSPGVVAYTEPLRDKRDIHIPFFSSTLGVAMNINAEEGGSPQLIHDGTDTPAWTGSNIQGNKVDFDRDDRPFSGTLSVRVNNPAEGDVWQFLAPSEIAAGSYASISMQINVDKDWTAGSDEIEIYLWDTSSDSQVGNSVSMSSYIDETDFDSWQKASVPLSDLGADSLAFDSVRMEQMPKSGKAAKLYIDEIKLIETGTAEDYIVSAPSGALRYHVHGIRIIMGGSMSGAVEDGTMQGLSYKKLMNVDSLLNGILITVFGNNEITSSGAIRQMSDIFVMGGSVTSSISDGSDSMVCVDIPYREPPILEGKRPDNYIRARVQDDLTGLDYLRMVVYGAYEFPPESDR